MESCHDTFTMFISPSCIDFSDAAYPSRQTPEDKKDNIRRSPYGKENKRKKKKKRQKEKKKEKENVLTVSLPKPCKWVYYSSATHKKN